MDEYYNSYAYPQVFYCFPCQDPYEDQDLEFCEELCECGWPWELCFEDPCVCWCWDTCFYW